MTRRYIAAEARELRRGPCAFEVSGVVIVNTHADAAIRCVADINDQPFGPLLAAAPDLAATVCALEAERDALRAAVREYLAARFDERHADATAFTAFWDTNNMLAPDYPQKCAAHSAARARWKDADEKRITALAALREAAK